MKKYGFSLVVALALLGLIRVFLFKSRSQNTNVYSQSLNAEEKGISESLPLASRKLASINSSETSASATTSSSNEAPKLKKVLTSSTRSLSPSESLKWLESNSSAKVKISQGVSGRPFRLYGNFNISSKELTSGSTEAAILEFLSYAAPSLEIDHPDQLIPTDHFSDAFIFSQFYKNIPVDSGQVRVFKDEKGIYLVNNSFVKDVSNLDIEPVLTQDGAKEIAVKDARIYDKDRREPGINSGSLFIHKFKDGELRLSWKFAVRQSWLGSSHGASVYFVDANNGNFERIEKALD